MGQLFSKNFCYRHSIIASSSAATAPGTPPPSPIVESSYVLNTTKSDAAATAASSNSKREDVQILRALAILSVLAFHLFPLRFPNGYLGVDMFFVISGYLMARILRKKAKPPSSSFQTLTRPIVRTFCWRRAKRIFPAYIFDILCVLLAAPFLLIGTELELLKADAKWATLFASNVQNILHKSVYAEVVSKLRYGIEYTV